MSLKTSLRRDCVAGIDIGLSGAVVCLSPARELVWWADIPSKTGKYDLSGVSYISRALATNCKDGVVFVEMPQSRPGHAVQSVLKTGFGHGIWEGVLSFLGVPFQRVHANVWTKHVGIQSMKRSLGKQRSIEIAGARCPDLPLDTNADGRADAFNIASYGLDQLEEWT